jgi:hypothetical protein
MPRDEGCLPDGLNAQGRTIELEAVVIDGRLEQIGDECTETVAIEANRSREVNVSGRPGVCAQPVSEEQGAFEHETAAVLGLAEPVKETLDPVEIQ